MPFVNYHFVHENNGEPMVCQCGYFFKLERHLVAPPLHKLMEIPDGGWFDPRAYNPDNNTYREWSWLKEQRITRFNALKSGEVSSLPLKIFHKNFFLGLHSGLRSRSFGRGRSKEKGSRRSRGRCKSISICSRLSPKTRRLFELSSDRITA